MRAVEDKRRLFLGTALFSERTARMEMAAARRIDRTRHVALQHDALAFARRIGHRRQQSPRVGMPRLPVELRGRRDLGYLAEMNR